MEYTKQELIDAYITARNCQESDLPALEIQIQTQIDNKRAALQTQLDEMPTTAKQRMKVVALRYLNKQAAEQTVIDNDGVSL